jgi:transposase
MGARGLPIRDDVSPSELRRLARHERDPAAARCMYAIANALEGMTRVQAARLAGMERQALHDAVVRYNAEGLKGLYNRRRPRRPGKLSSAELQELSQITLARPDPGLGLSAWTLPDSAAPLKHASTSTCTPRASRACCGERVSRDKERGSAIPVRIRQRRRRFKKGAFGGGQPGERGTSRQAHSIMVPAMRPGSGERAAFAIVGGDAASALPAFVTGATLGCISSLLSIRQPARGLPWSCPKSRPRR